MGYIEDTDTYDALYGQESGVENTAPENNSDLHHDIAQATEIVMI